MRLNLCTICVFDAHASPGDASVLQLLGCMLQIERTLLSRRRQCLGPLLYHNNLLRTYQICRFTPHVSGFFEGVIMGPIFTDFLCKIHQIGRHIPVYLIYKKYPLRPWLKRHPNNSDFINFGMHRRPNRYENFATKLWKKCWKGAPF